MLSRRNDYDSYDSRRLTYRVDDDFTAAGFCRLIFSSHSSSLAAFAWFVWRRRRRRRRRRQRGGRRIVSSWPDNDVITERYACDSTRRDKFGAEGHIFFFQGPVGLRDLGPEVHGWAATAGTGGRSHRVPKTWMQWRLSIDLQRSHWGPQLSSSYLRFISHSVSMPSPWSIRPFREYSDSSSRPYITESETFDSRIQSKKKRKLQWNVLVRASFVFSHNRGFLRTARCEFSFFRKLNSNERKG